MCCAHTTRLTNRRYILELFERKEVENCRIIRVEVGARAPSQVIGGITVFQSIKVDQVIKGDHVGSLTCGQALRSRSKSEVKSFRFSESVWRKFNVHCGEHISAECESLNCVARYGETLAGRFSGVAPWSCSSNGMSEEVGVSEDSLI